MMFVLRVNPQSSGLIRLSTIHFNSILRKSMNTEAPFKTYLCLICGYIYDEEQGDPEEGLAPGTRWEDVPVNWVCPECGARKEDFEMIEI